MTTPVSNPYEWPAIQRMIATAYAAGRLDQRCWPVCHVDQEAFVDAVEAAGLRFGDFQALYERMARGETTPTELPVTA